MDSSGKIYLDHNATTPPDPRVLAAMEPYLREHFGNASAVHRPGIEARTGIERARREVARVIGATPEEIVFTSGGSESDNLALKGVAEAARQRGDKRNRVLSFAGEHPAVTETLEDLQRGGWETQLLPINAEGWADLRALESELEKGGVALVSLMAANNEIGTIQPIQEAARLAREAGALFHTDAVQAFGKIPLDAETDGFDLLSISGHKIYGVLGAGALYVKQGTELARQIAGGGQEGGLRGGTLNTPGIVALGEAARITREEMADEARWLTDLREYFWEKLSGAFPGIERNGPAESCLPGTLNVSFPPDLLNGNDGRRIVTDLAARGIACSSGSACSNEMKDDSGEGVQLSPVLLACGHHAARAAGAVRFSLGRSTTHQSIDAVIVALRHLGAEND